MLSFAKVKKDEPVLEAKSEAHAANMLQLPIKKKSEEPEPVPKPETPKEPEAPVEAAPPAVPLGNTEELMSEFLSGKMLGEELEQWVEENRASLPSVERIVFALLDETEKDSPDIECGWAEPTKYGAALVSLVTDNVVAQMQVLWGIQKYCDQLGFPKINDEYLVQAMFRSMYKYDLAEDDAFSEWKEDESEEHEGGKLKAIIQTVDWFNWLEEEDDDDEEDYEE